MEERYGVSSWLNACLTGFRMEGFDDQAIIKLSGIDPCCLEHGYCSVAVYNAVFKAAAKLYGDSAALAARRGVLPTSFQSLSLAMMSAESIHESLSLVVTHGPSITNAIRFFVEDTTHPLFGFMPAESVVLEPGVAIALLGAVVKTARFIHPSQYCITGIDIANPKPQAQHIYPPYFKVPIRWGADYYALHYRKDLFDSPSILSNPAIKLKAEENWCDEVIEMKQGQFITRVRSIIESNLDNGLLSLDFIAQAFGMSTRTFQRRLDSENTTLKQLIDLVKKNKALELIKHTEMMVSEVAYTLGFADVGNFSRAFRRWFSSSPEQYRKEHKAAI